MTVEAALVFEGLTDKEKHLLKNYVENDLMRVVKNRIVKGAVEESTEAFLLFHIKLYLEAVRTSLLSEFKDKSYITKKQVEAVFEEILQRNEKDK